MMGFGTPLGVLCLTQTLLNSCNSLNSLFPDRRPATAASLLGEGVGLSGQMLGGHFHSCPHSNSREEL